VVRHMSNIFVTPKYMISLHSNPLRTTLADEAAVIIVIAADVFGKLLPTNELREEDTTHE
jgi:hypothetical protein